MELDFSPAGHEALVVAQFGEQAAEYVSSAVHSGGVDLQHIAGLAKPGDYSAALDLGCGGGHVAYALAPNVGRVVACDLSQGMLDAVAAEAARRSLPNIETRLAAAELLPFEDGSFDLVVSRYSAHHWRDWESGIREARRVVRPGGRVVFVDVVTAADAALDTHLQAVELLRDPSHVRDRSIAEWVGAIGRAGLALSAVTPFRLPLHFETWVRRMRTPDVACRAIRLLQAGATAQTRIAFEISEDGDFVVDAVLIEAEPRRC